MDEDLHEEIAKARSSIKEIDEGLEDVAWHMAKLEKDAPAATDLAAYMAYRASLEDLRYRQISLRLDRLAALNAQEHARTRNVRRGTDRLRAEIGTMIEERLDRRSQS